MREKGRNQGVRPSPARAPYLPDAAADIRIVSETANFAVPFVKWAMATGVNQLHYALPLGIALEMAFTAESAPTRLRR